MGADASPLYFLWNVSPGFPTAGLARKLLMLISTSRFCQGFWKLSDSCHPSCPQARPAGLENTASISVVAPRRGTACHHTVEGNVIVGVGHQSACEGTDSYEGCKSSGNNNSFHAKKCNWLTFRRQRYKEKNEFSLDIHYIFYFKPFFFVKSLLRVQTFL